MTPRHVHRATEASRPGRAAPGAAGTAASPLLVRVRSPWAHPEPQSVKTFSKSEFSGVSRATRRLPRRRATAVGPSPQAKSPQRCCSVSVALGGEGERNTRLSKLPLLPLLLSFFTFPCSHLFLPTQCSGCHRCHQACTHLPFASFALVTQLSMSPVSPGLRWMPACAEVECPPENQEVTV